MSLFSADDASAVAIKVYWATLLTIHRAHDSDMLNGLVPWILSLIFDPVSLLRPPAPSFALSCSEFRGA